jgi:hypothetical protein
VKGKTKQAFFPHRGDRAGDVEEWGLGKSVGRQIQQLDLPAFLYDKEMREIPGRCCSEEWLREAGGYPDSIDRSPHRSLQPKGMMNTLTRGGRL